MKSKEANKSLSLNQSPLSARSSLCSFGQRGRAICSIWKIDQDPRLSFQAGLTKGKNQMLRVTGHFHPWDQKRSISPASKKVQQSISFLPDLRATEGAGGGMQVNFCNTP